MFMKLVLNLMNNLTTLLPPFSQDQVIITKILIGSIGAFNFKISSN